MKNIGQLIAEKLHVNGWLSVDERDDLQPWQKVSVVYLINQEIEKVYGKQTDEAALKKAFDDIKDLFCATLPDDVDISEDKKKLVDEQLPVILAALREKTAATKPYEKIFDHKWLDPNCIEKGCQSLAVAPLIEAAYRVVAAFKNQGSFSLQVQCAKLETALAALASQDTPPNTKDL